jgi:hypothetical protein
LTPRARGVKFPANRSEHPLPWKEKLMYRFVALFVALAAVVLAVADTLPGGH